MRKIVTCCLAACLLAGQLSGQTAGRSGTASPEQARPYAKTGPQIQATRNQSPAIVKTTHQPAMLNHIALYVVNLQTSTDFYSRIIGLDSIPEPFHDGLHTWFRIGPHSQLHLIQGATAATEHNKNNHTCFSVPSITDFIARLQENKIPFENWAGEKNTVTNRPDGIRQLWFGDPDGYWIEINDDYPKNP